MDTPVQITQQAQKSWLLISSVLVNLDFVTKIRVGGASNNMLIFHHAVSRGASGGDAATQAFTYADNAAALVAFGKVKDHMDNILRKVQEIV